MSRNGLASNLTYFLIAGWTFLPILSIFWLSFDSSNDELQQSKSIASAVDTAPIYAAFVNSTLVAMFSAVLVLLLGFPAGYYVGNRLPQNYKTSFGMILGRALPASAIILPILTFSRYVQLPSPLLLLGVLHAAVTLPFFVSITASMPWRKARLTEQTALLDGGSFVDTRLRLWTHLFAPSMIFGFLLALLLSWNEFGFAVMLTGGEYATLPVLMVGFETIRGVEWTRLSTVLMLAIAPPMLFVLFSAILANSRFRKRIPK